MKGPNSDSDLVEDASPSPDSSSEDLPPYLREEPPEALVWITPGASRLLPHVPCIKHPSVLRSRVQSLMLLPACAPQCAPCLMFLPDPSYPVLTPCGLFPSPFL
ncbi:uncharacterized protein [Paramormyrops kingsleyae]|uniref:uncharacterized protein isoform X2 n=1 Tax=Paramormyrops kingsleyae TaxID=1676925 RepID=UPI000CD60E69|nr:uncharacterized protein LOC111841607 isoform X2 [Paramormyrops kingsleyae]